MPRPLTANREFTLGTHNLHDRAESATPFADVIVFTEAPKDKKGLATMRRRLPDHTIVVCRRQRSLMIAYRTDGPFKPRRVKPRRYVRAHAGRKAVTPARGTFEVIGTVWSTPSTVFAEHRINKSYDAAPGSFRRKRWNQHKRRTGRLIKRHQKKGRAPLGGGDTNTSGRMSGKFASLAYDNTNLAERGSRLDRLGVDRTFRAGDAEYLSKSGSDHPRLRVTIHQP